MENLSFIQGIGGTEVLLILFVVLFFFGAKKIPELARGLGTGIRQFKDAVNGVKEEITKTDEETKKTDLKKELPSHETSVIDKNQEIN